MSTAAYAEYTAVPASSLIPIPSGISSETAAAALLQGLTALTLIKDAHKVNKGDWTLVHAAAGGVGGWLVKLIKAKGAHVVGSASSEEKRKLVMSYGADVCVPYEEVLATVKAKTDGKGVVAAFDGVGKVTFDEDLKAVGRKGTVVSFGNASGAVEPLKIARLSEKNLKVVRPTLFNYVATREELEAVSKELWELVEGGVEVAVHEIYPLAEVARAHNDIEGRKTTGKLLLKP